MAGRKCIEVTENVKIKYCFHEVSRSIKLATPAASGGADSGAIVDGTSAIGNQLIFAIRCCLARSGTERKD
jgi:hypothetical protein